MTFVLPTPTLQHLAAVTIVGQLWNRRSIFIETAKLISEPYIDSSDRQYSEEWKKIVGTVKGKASALPLPETIKKLLQNFVDPLGFEILNWFERNRQQRCDSHSFRNFLPEQFCWTFLGTVDFKKTARLMIKDEKLDIEKRYKIACANCLEADIRRLIERLPEDRKQFCIDEVRYLGTLFHLDLVSFWTCTVSGDTDELNKYFQKKDIQGDDNINQYLLKRALSLNNRAASEYFFENLSQNGKDELLVKLPTHSDAIASCLLRRLSEPQQEKLLKEHYVYVLKELIRWPNQPLFVETLKRGMPFMDRDSFIDVSYIIGDKTLRGYDNNYYNYDEWYLIFWQLSSDELKNEFLDNEFCAYFLLHNGERFIKMLLDEFTVLQFDKFLTSDYAMLSLKDIVKDEETLNGWKRKVALEYESERDEEKRSKCENVLRIFDSLLEK